MDGYPGNIVMILDLVDRAHPREIGRWWRILPLPGKQCEAQRETVSVERPSIKVGPSDAERARLLENPGFGSVFTDHMVLINYDEGKGWHDARVAPYAPIPVDPASAVLHYAQEIFEGLKAYRLCDGTIGF